MADNVTLNVGSAGDALAADDIGGVKHQRVKIQVGADGSATDVQFGQAAMASSLPVAIASDQSAVPISGTLTAVTSITNVVSVDDNGGSLTVDNSTLAVVGAGTEAAAMRVTIANDSTGLLSVDDNGGSLTIDNATLAVVGAGTEAAAMRVTIATDSTGLLSVDDGGGSLTVDASALDIRALVNTDVVTAELSAVDNAVLDVIAAGYAVEGAALASGVLIQGDDGADRTNVLVDTDGHLQIDVLSGGGGTEYTDDTDTHSGASVGGLMMAAATPTDTAVDANDIGAVAMSLDRRLHVDADLTAIGDIATETTLVAQSAKLPAALGSTTSAASLSVVLASDHANVTVDGAVTANAGTDLNTSALALDTTLVTQSAKLPATLGQTTKAASLAVTLASDEDNLNVDATSVVPGTGATNLGKAIDSPTGATDTGVAMLAKHQGDTTHVTVADDDYDVLRIAEFGGLHVNPEQHHVIDNMNATTGWGALGNDTLNLALTSVHVLGSGSLSFDKVDGAANTVLGGIEKTISSTNFDGLSLHDILQTVVFVPSVADVSYVFLRLGTNSSNYNEWRIDGADLSDAQWETLVFEIGDAAHAGAAGSGVDWAAVTYVAVGLAFNAETDTLAGILFDEISFHTNQHVNASINSEVTSSVSSANVNIQKVGNKVVNTMGGNVSTGTQRVTIATDDVNLAALVAAQLPDGHNVTVDNGAAGAAVNIQDGGNEITVDQAVAANLNMTEASAADIKTAVETVAATVYIDDTSTHTATVSKGQLMMAVSVPSDPAVDNNDIGALSMSFDRRLFVDSHITGQDADVTVDNGGTFAVQSTLQAGTAAIGKLTANSGVDIGDVDVTSLPGSVDGPGAPSIDSYATADVNLAASTANQSIVAAPGADKQIWVYGLVLLAAAASTVSIQDEDDVALSGIIPVAETGGFTINPSGNFSMPWIKVATNKALEIDTGAGTVDGIVTYAIVSV